LTFYREKVIIKKVFIKGEEKAGIFHILSQRDSVHRLKDGRKEKNCPFTLELFL
jgi:hypothetical protein